MKNLPIIGSDVSEITPASGVFHVGGIIRNPLQKISIKWEIDNASGSTECEAWRGQYEIDVLTKSGYTIKSICLFY